jgi:hypothetical protein
MIFYAGEGIATAPPHGERSRAKRACADEVIENSRPPTFGLGTMDQLGRCLT